MSFINCQYHVYYDDFSMHAFGNINALTMQRRRCCANILMIVFAIMNIPARNIVCIMMIFRCMCLTL